MEKWEYLTRFISAVAENAARENPYQFDHLQELPRNAPEAMIPELNQLGEKGWELVHMQPVKVGTNHDVMVHGDNMRHWSETYFCVFKRRL